jgi:hypothetical protein
MQLFYLFWPFNILQNIINEISCYTITGDGEGEFKGGWAWTTLIVLEFKAWLAIQLYMDKKQQPNIKNY